MKIEKRIKIYQRTENLKSRKMKENSKARLSSLREKFKK